ncbi:MAG: PKD domain-containing protein [Saprospiraceae bacterium]|nr:PKD domain-containing protein [Saprospiraceae bacterium]
MKNILHLTLACSILLAIANCLVSCKKEKKPEALFNVYNDGCTAPCEIEFINESKNSSYYRWNFGDMSPVSSDEDPKHTFSSAGEYEVTLTAFNENGEDEITQKVLVVAPPIIDAPNAAFSVINDGCIAPCTITFENQSSNETSYQWNFGEGGTSNAKDPTHLYQSSGSYDVTLKVTGPGGVDSVTNTVVINSPTQAQPIADFTFNNNGCLAPCTVTFNNNSQNSSSYSWDFGDGGTSTQGNPTHTYQYGGVFSVSLKAKGNGGLEDVATAEITITTPNSPLASFTVNNDWCNAPCTVSFNNTSQNSNSYQWDFGDGGTSTQVSPSHTYQYGGVFYVSLKATGNGGLSDVASTEVFINSAPLYTEARIIKTEVTYIPNLPPNDCTYWGDGCDGPDIYTAFWDYTTQSYASNLTCDIVLDIQSWDLPQSWVCQTPCLIPSKYNTYAITVWDSDSPFTDTQVGISNSFRIQDYIDAGNFPSTIYLDNNSIGVTLYLQWQ